MRVSLIMWFIIGILLLILLLLTVFGCSSSCFKEVKNTLIIIAHPDDESMFFTPVILSLRKFNSEVFILCLSEGDYYGEGSLRRKELVSAAKNLFIFPKNVHVISHKQLPDDPNSDWSKDITSYYITDMIKRHNIQRIISFDRFGISNHKNHISINTAIRWLHKECKLIDIDVFLLETTNVINKYLTFLNVYTILISKYYVVSGFSNWIQGMRALYSHKSQMIWFRKLYSIFSSYMIINTFEKL